MTQIAGQAGPGPDATVPARPAYGLCLLVMLLHVVDGVDMQLLGVTVNALVREWGLPLSAFGTAMAAGHVGAAVGAALGGLLGDRIGRKPTIIGGVLIFSLASFAMAGAGLPWQLAALRFVAGIGLGGCLPPALALLTESMPPRYRGLSISLVMLCFPLGIALSGFLAVVLIPQAGWQAMFLTGGVLPLILAVLLLVGLREPRAAAVGRPEDPAVAGDRTGLLWLLSGPERGTLWPLLAVFFCCYFVTNMSLSWLPGLMAHLGAEPGIANGMISVWSLSGMAGIILAGLIMTRWGSWRAVGVHVGGGALAVCALIIASAAGIGPADPALVVLIGLAGFMLTGAIATLFTYCTDSFRPQHRSSAIGLVATAGRLGAIVGSGSGARFIELGGAVAFFGAGAVMLGLALLLYGIGFRRPAAT